MGTFLIFIASLVLLFQFLLDYLFDSKKLKLIIGITVLIGGLASIWVNYGIQQKDTKKSDKKHKQEIDNQVKRFDKIDSLNIILNSELKLRNKDLKTIKNQNDSLKIQIYKLNEKQDKFLILSQFSAKEISKSRTAIENLGYKKISRGISQYDKLEMVKILKNYKNGTVTIGTILGDSEAFQFSSEIKEVFKTANWIVEGINQSVYTTPISGIFILVKSKKYPIRVNGIFEAFKILNLTVKGEISPDLGDEDIKLIIGAQ
ncbi:MAG: hypothetical protein L3J25_06120 [Flavobacteriaceae bacterium]|nr:hypothetical protein [Flavobacteriaceae bacterium]